MEQSNIHNINILQKFYNKQKYLDLYGGSVIISLFFIFLVFSLFSYFHLSKKFNKIRKNWTKYRCNPQVIPLAGIINKDPHKSILETTAVNFNGCITNILTEITGDFLSPIYYITSTLEYMAKSVVNDVQMVRTKIGSIVGNMVNIDKEIMGRIMNFLMPLRLMLIKLKDMISKNNASMVSGIYTAIAGYLGVKSFFGAFIVIMGVGLAFASATAAALNAFIFTAPLAIPFEVIAGIIGGVLIFMGILKALIRSKT